MRDEAKKIKLDNIEFHSNFLYVSGASTSFISASINEKFDVPDLLRRHNKVVKAARAKGIKVSLKSGHKKKLNENLQQYLIDYNSSKELFDEITEVAKSKVEDGIYAPTSEDPELGMISELTHQLGQFFRSSTPLSIVSSAARRIEEVERFVYAENTTVIQFSI